MKAYYEKWLQIGKNKLSTQNIIRNKIVPLAYSDASRIEKFEHITFDFFDKIIGINIYDCFISDLSSLHDFGLANEKTLKKIESEYGIIPSGKDYFLSDIFEQINEKASNH